MDEHEPDHTFHNPTQTLKYKRTNTHTNTRKYRDGGKREIK